MHLWPSMRLRDSFKIAYLKKLELNLHRMNSEKRQQQQQQQQQQNSQSSTSNSNNNSNDYQHKLLDDNNKDNPAKGGKFIALCRELLLILSCCYCCFCCGGRGSFYDPSIGMLITGIYQKPGNLRFCATCVEDEEN